MALYRALSRPITRLCDLWWMLKWWWSSWSACYCQHIMRFLATEFLLYSSLLLHSVDNWTCQTYKQYSSSKQHNIFFFAFAISNIDSICWKRMHRIISNFCESVLFIHKISFRENDRESNHKLSIRCVYFRSHDNFAKIIRLLSDWQGQARNVMCQL